MTDKPSFEEHLATCVKELGFDADAAKAETLYKINITSAHQAVLMSDELKNILSFLQDIKSRYANGNAELLFYRPDALLDVQFQQKPFKSCISKIYRHDVVYNRNYPKPPRDDFWGANGLYDNIDDLIRSRLICKYMDGPQFICNELSRLCEASGIDCMHRDLGTDAGYYAWHFYFKVPVNLSIGGDVITRSIWVELQFSTQLAEAITALTHGLYEARREGSTNPRDQGWKWDAGSQRFRSAYIGHGLHLLEGMIQTFRDDVLSVGTKHGRKSSTDEPNSVADRVHEPTPVTEGKK